MKYLKYLPAIIGCAGLLVYLLSFFYTGPGLNMLTALGLFVLGVVVSLFIGFMGWNKDLRAGWLGLWINLLPLGILGFIFMNATFNK